VTAKLLLFAFVFVANRQKISSVYFTLFYNSKVVNVLQLITEVTSGEFQN